MSIALHTALSLLERGDLEGARRTLLSSLRARSGRSDPDVLRLLGYVCAAVGDAAAAEYHISRAGSAEGAFPADELALRCAGAMGEAGRKDESVAILGLAVRQHPDSRALCGNLAHWLAECGRLVECERIARSGVERWPDDGVLATNLAHALTQLGRADLALPHWRSAFEPIGPHPTVTSGLLGALNYADGLDLREVHDEHARVAGVIAASAPQALAEYSVGAQPAINGTSDLAGPLRIGLLSGDLNAHAVSFFAETVIEHADPDEAVICCYATSAAADAVAVRLRGRVVGKGGCWRVIAGMDDDAAARAIRADSLNVLIDLSGHTHGGRPGVLARRPAPVQVTWLGYPNTTGLAAVGWRIVDSLTDPPALGADGWSVERLLRIDPCFLGYRPPALAHDPPSPTPAPPERPPGGTAGATFGSFNLLAKLSERTVDLWSRLLERTPGSHLLLKAKALSDEQTRAWVIERFARRGVDKSRVQAVPPTPTFSEHLATYARVDVALDPFPYHGTTTTCEALYMGVPVVTLAGGSHASRVGVSLLSVVGLSDLVATDEDEYLRIASQLAADAGRLANLRSPGSEGLRARMLGSPLCDGTAFTRRWIAALRSICDPSLR